VIWRGFIIVAISLSVSWYCDDGVMFSGRYVRDGAAACGRRYEIGTEFVLDGERLV